MQMTFGKTAFG